MRCEGRGRIRIELKVRRIIKENAGRESIVEINRCGNVKMHYRGRDKSLGE